MAEINCDIEGTPLWSITKSPSALEIKAYKQKFRDLKVLKVFVSYDYFPTSSGELNLDYLSDFEQITSLNLRYVAGLRSLDFLRELPNLKRLSISQTKTTRLDLSPLKAVHLLESLSLDKQKHNLEVISEISQLRSLNLQSISVPNLSFLSKASKLRELRLALGGSRDINFIHDTKIQYLQLWQILNFSDDDLVPVAEAESLEHLFLDQLKQVTRLPRLNKLQKLRRVDCKRMLALTDIAGLFSAPVLEELVLDTPKVRIDVLKSLKDLKSLRAVSFSNRSSKQLAEVLRLPRVQDNFSCSEA